MSHQPRIYIYKKKIIRKRNDKGISLFPFPMWKKKKKIVDCAAFASVERPIKIDVSSEFETERSRSMEIGRSAIFVSGIFVERVMSHRKRESLPLRNGRHDRKVCACTRARVYAARKLRGPGKRWPYVLRVRVCAPESFSASIRKRSGPNCARN